MKDRLLGTKQGQTEACPSATDFPDVDGAVWPFRQVSDADPGISRKALSVGRLSNRSGNRQHSPVLPVQSANAFARICQAAADATTLCKDTAAILAVLSGRRTWIAACPHSGLSIAQANRARGLIIRTRNSLHVNTPSDFTFCRLPRPAIIRSTFADFMQYRSELMGNITTRPLPPNQTRLSSTGPRLSLRTSVTSTMCVLREPAECIMRATTNGARSTRCFAGSVGGFGRTGIGRAAS